jgi:putative phosphoribosyl transferase
VAVYEEGQAALRLPVGNQLLGGGGRVHLGTGLARATMTFADRVDAGRQLAAALMDLRDQDPVVLGLPRGGIVVAAEVAGALGAQLDVIIVRKLGVPSQPELAMGAVAEGGIRVISDQVVRYCGVTAGEVTAVEQHALGEMNRQAQLFRGGRPRVALTGRTVIVVDDGIATGSTAGAACETAGAQGAVRVVLAAPVGAPDAVAGLSRVADEIRCLQTPSWLGAIGQFYRDFSQISDAQVVVLLRDDPAGRHELRRP